MSWIDCVKNEGRLTGLVTSYVVIAFYNTLLKNRGAIVG
jgi:hypothetical protein